MAVVVICAVFLSPTLHAKTTDLSSINPQVQYEMGSKFRLGIDVTANPDVALEWYTRAANQGFAKGEYAVGWMLAFNDEDQADYEAALPWIIKASGQHDSPQGFGYEDTQKRATRKLEWMCKKGVVEFPSSHPMAHDSKCWLARGNRLFHGRDKFGELVGVGRKYNVDRDYVAARLFLEKAFDAGETSAAVNLASIYKKGLGTPKDAVKFDYFLKFAADNNDGNSNYFLAERAKIKGENLDYIDRLERAAADQHTRATRELAFIKLRGDISPKDTETALMYLLVSNSEEFLRSQDTRRGDMRFPGQRMEMLEFFRSENAETVLPSAKSKADAFAETHRFKARKIEKVERSYRIASGDLTYVNETGGDWYKSQTWTFMFIMLFMLITISAFGRFFKRLAKPQ